MDNNIYLYPDVLGIYVEWNDDSVNIELTDPQPQGKLIIKKIYSIKLYDVVRVTRLYWLNTKSTLLKMNLENRNNGSWKKNDKNKNKKHKLCRTV